MFPEVVQTFVERGGITNHISTVYSLSNISAKNHSKSVDVGWIYIVQH